MISKELLSEILKKDTPYINIKNNYIYYEEFGSMTGTLIKNINIYELAHKCKEWAWYQDREHTTTTIKTSKTLLGVYRAWINDDDEWFADTEPESIFKACEWLLDNQIPKDDI